MGDLFSAAPTKKDDDYKILDAGAFTTNEYPSPVPGILSVLTRFFAARSMMATSRYWTSHGTDGYTREAAEDEAKGSVLYRLQRARLATRLARQAIPDAR